MNAQLIIGDLNANDLAWREGLKEWIPLLALIGRAPPPSVPSKVKKFDPNEKIPEFDGQSFWATSACSIVFGFIDTCRKGSFEPLILTVAVGIPFALLVSFLRQKFRGFFAKGDAIAEKIFWIFTALFFIAALCFFVFSWLAERSKTQ